MKYRKLRIAWSVGWGVVAVLLCLLSWRSYYVTDSVGVGNAWFCDSCRGKFLVAIWEPHLRLSNVADHSWQYESLVADEPLPGSQLGFWNDKSDIGLNGFCVPHFLLIFVNLALASIPWIPRRFRLRTLLIATTLVAVVLGLLVYLFRD
jgi:hypothetical protein